MQLLKEGCTEASVDLQVMQLSQKRITHRAIHSVDQENEKLNCHH